MQLEIILTKTGTNTPQVDGRRNPKLYLAGNEFCLQPKQIFFFFKKIPVYLILYPS